MNRYGDIGNAVAGWYSRRLLSHAIPTLILEMFGLIKPLPKHQTKIIQFRRSLPFIPATIPLTEGITPSGSDFGYDTITTQIQQFGDWAGISDVIQDTSKDMVLRDMSERQGEQIGETREALTWDVVRAGTSVVYGGSATDAAPSARTGVAKAHVLNALKQRSVTTGMRAAKAKKFTKILKGSPDYQTWKIEASYIAVGHTDMDSTVRDLKGNNENDLFTPTARYSSSMGVVSPHEVGNFEQVRYVLSADLTPFLAAGAAIASGDEATYKFSLDSASAKKYDVYATLFLGKEAFGGIPLRGQRAVRPMVVQPKPAAGDPLAQRGSVGWKMWFACVILNDAWMTRLETVAAK